MPAPERAASASRHADPSREVALEQELDSLRQYVRIQQARFKDR
jgi:LytS/YehU family sensor histidine kinase